MICFLLRAAFLAVTCLVPLVVMAQEKAPLVLLLDAEFGHATSTSAEAIRRGMELAIDEVNESGGLLGGRRLELKTSDNRSVPSRAKDNVRAAASDPNLIAVFSGKFSPVVQELIPMVHELELPLMAVWSAADNITDNGNSPNYVFRLSMRDTWAIERLMDEARSRKLERVGLMLPNSGWGRSSQAAAEAYMKRNGRPVVASVQWYNWGDASLIDKYREMLQRGKAQAVIMVANEGEGATLVKEMAALPKEQRLPILSHWGITGGQFAKMAGDALAAVDLSVVQTYSFVGAHDPVAKRVLDRLRQRYAISDPKQIEAPVGLAHAYDMTHILAAAIKRAGSASRPAIRAALEQSSEYRGLVRTYKPPFNPVRHEALGIENVFLSRFAPDGSLVRIAR